MRELLNDSRVAHLAELKKKFRRLSFMKNWSGRAVTRRAIYAGMVRNLS
jgi:hypothetical protein